MTNDFYVVALEHCNVYTKGPLTTWSAGSEFGGGRTGPPPGMTTQRYVYAFNPFNQATCAQTPCPLSLAWSYPQTVAGAMGGLLATAGGLVFVAGGSGALSALDASTGGLLWTYNGSNVSWKSSPITYQINGKQYIALARYNSVAVFGL